MKRYINTIINRINTLLVNKMGFVVLSYDCINTTDVQGVLYCEEHCGEGEEEGCCGGECGCDEEEKE